MYTDARNAALRAIGAIDAAAAIRGDPGNRHAVLARDYPYNPGIDRRRGQYEYRVIVKGSGRGNDFETLVFVRSREKLSGDDIVAQAERMFRRNEDLHRDYQRRIDQLGAAPTVNSYIMSATRHPS